MAVMGAPVVPAAVQPPERAEPGAPHRAVLAAMSRSPARSRSHRDLKGFWSTRMGATRPAVPVGVAEQALVVLAERAATVLLPVAMAVARARPLRPSSQMTALVSFHSLLVAPCLLILVVLQSVSALPRRVLLAARH